MSKIIPFAKRKTPVVVRKPRQVVPMPSPAPKPQPLHNPSVWTVPPDVDTDTPYGQAKLVLRNRVTRTEQDFFLDGKRTGFYDVIREANRLLKDAGMAQIKGSPGWEV